MKIIHIGRGEKIPFKYRVFRDDIFVTGHKGEGKTDRAKKILAHLINGGYPFWIWSPQLPLEKYGEFATPKYSIGDLDYGRNLYCGAYNEKTFHLFVERAYQTGNIVLFLDDIHEQVHKHSVQEDLARLVQSGRNRGICSVFVSTRPAAIPNWILENVSHIFAYRMLLESSAEWLAKNYFGKEAWLLVSKEKRKKHCYDSDQDIDILPEYSYLYRNIYDKDTILALND